MDELHAHSKAELKPAHPKFGDTLVPRYAFYMPTEHTKKDMHKKIKERYARLLNSIPVKDRAMAEVFLDKKIHGMVSDEKPRSEAHILVVAQNTANGFYEGYVNSAHREGTDAFKGETAALMGECDDLDFAIMQSGMTATKMRYGEDWHGTRGQIVEIEAKTFSEFMAKIEAAGIKDAFLATYPDTETAVITASVPSKQAVMTPARRKELVKRFGAKQIKALEDKMKANV